MTDQRKLAARILKCGKNRIWMAQDPRVAKAITRADIVRLIDEGLIKKRPLKQKAKIQRRKRKKAGSIKGARGARQKGKEVWLNLVRPQRKLLKKLKLEKKIDQGIYRKTYLMIKGGVFRNQAHMLAYLKDKFKKEVSK